MNTKFSKCGILTVALLAPMVAWGECSPIVLDIGKDGIHLGEAGTGVYFDVNADGIQDHVQWLRPKGDEAFLAIDRNGNQIIDDGTELFGVGTRLFFEGGTASNGFIGLAQYDLPELGGNDDGLITRADQIWSELYLWNDKNADGKSVLSEMSRPADAGLLSFETIPKMRKYHDEAGNVIPYWAWAGSVKAPKNMLMVDVFFLLLQEQSSFCSPDKTEHLVADSDHKPSA